MLFTYHLSLRTEALECYVFGVTKLVPNTRRIPVQLIVLTNIPHIVVSRRHSPKQTKKKK